MSKTKDRRVKNGYQRAQDDQADQQRRARERAEALRAFAGRYDAMAALDRYANDWREGFGSSTDTTHTIGHSTGDTRVFGEAAAGMLDHKTDPITDEEITTKIPTREGHGLAERAATHRARIQAWINEGERLDRELYNLLPVDHPIAMMRAHHRAVGQAGAGICLGCGRTVPGIREDKLLGIKADRIKSGYCFGQPDECYAKWIALGRPDPAVFQRQAFPPTGKDEGEGEVPDRA